MKTSAMRWFFLCINANEACFSERIRHKKAQDAEGELVFIVIGTVHLRVLLSEAKKILIENTFIVSRRLNYFIDVISFY
jgi:hypothetical protein